MRHSTILNTELAKMAEINKQILGVLCNDTSDLFKNVIQNDLSGLFFNFRQFWYGHTVCLDSWEWQVSLIIHFHTVLDQELLSQADNNFLGVGLSNKFWGELHYKCKDIKYCNLQRWWSAIARVEPVPICWMIAIPCCSFVSTERGAFDWVR